MLEKLRKYACLWIILAVVYALGLAAVITTPEWPGIESLSKTFWLFGLSGIASILILAIAVFLLVRWVSEKQKNTTVLIWSVSFFLYSLTFIGLCLQSFGFSWADSSIPSIFFIYRNTMILWAAGMYYGLSLIIFKKSILRDLPTALILLLGYSWFSYGLLSAGDIELTMYGFLHFIFIPVCWIIAYLFYKYAYENRITSMKIISAGFAWLAVTYMAWAPWHKNNVYVLWFFLFTLALVMILIGFTSLVFEKRVIKAG